VLAGAVHPIHQQEKKCFPAGRTGLSTRFTSTKRIAFVLAVRGCPPDSLAGKKLLSRWPYGAVHPIHQRENNCFPAGRTGLSTRFTSTKRIAFVLAVRGCPPDSPAGKQFLSC